MALMHLYCLCCSARLSTLCTTVITLIHGATSLLLAILALQNLEQTSSFLRKIFNDLKISDTVAEKLIERLEQYVSIAAVYFTFLSMASALAIFGTIKCKKNLLYPFLFLYGLYVVILISYNVTIMLHFRQNDASLGLFILYCNLGAFILLYFIYKWYCVISFIQVLSKITEDINRRREIEEMKALAFKSKAFPFNTKNVYHY